ncbi:DUF4129 domain-containing protein [Haloarchaeobius sp. HRN-SO-5]|uniref:DUF4129 domain-containing protein n=1 Tax=Haloarchaeobius sp. HRN-SO-5 TaxID=3446118 RepID=UPI003EBD9F47
MDRRRLLPVVLAVVCVLTLAFAAATLADPAQSDGGGASAVGSTPEETGPAGSDGSSSARPLTDPGDFVLDLGFCVPFLVSAQFVAIVLLLAVGIWAVVQYRADGFTAAAVVVTIAFPGLFVWLFFTNCTRPDQPERFSILPSDPVPPLRGDESSFGFSQDPGVVVQPTVVLVLLATTLVVGVVGYVVWSGEHEARGEPDPEPEDEGTGTVARVAALGTVAGRAADRLEQTDATENEVYRAWVEMTTYLPVEHPKSSTPAEFASAAVDAGVARDDVADLTRLFEEVRYGGEPVTDERESRAIDALRAIEAEYGETDG